MPPAQGPGKWGAWERAVRGALCTEVCVYPSGPARPVLYSFQAGVPWAMRGAGIAQSRPREGASAHWGSGCLRKARRGHQDPVTSARLRSQGLHAQVAGAARFPLDAQGPALSCPPSPAPAPELKLCKEQVELAQGVTHALGVGAQVPQGLVPQGAPDGLQAARQLLGQWPHGHALQLAVHDDGAGR